MKWSWKRLVMGSFLFYVVYYNYSRHRQTYYTAYLSYIYLKEVH